MTDPLPEGWLHVIVDVPPASARRSAQFWSAALGWPLGAPWPGHPEFASFEAPGGDAYVHRQVGDHGPRIHFDIEVSDVDAARKRLRALGAGVGAATAEWQTMRSPGGLPFCLLPRKQAGRPTAQRWPDGHRTRPVQVCLDISAAMVDVEVAMWQQFLGWRFEPGGSPEFEGKAFPDPRLPVQLLFQRLAAPESRTRTHLDLGSDDVEAEVARLVAFGASRGSTGDGWVVLTDPVGMEFCVTANAPD